MIDSPHWRPHIVPGKWKLLERLTLIPDDSQSLIPGYSQPSIPGYSQPLIPDYSQTLRRCINNSELMDAIINMGDPTAMALWLAVLWYKHDELLPRIRKQLEVITGEMARSGGTVFDACLSVIESELGRIKRASIQRKKNSRALSRSAPPIDPKAARQIQDLQQAVEALTAIETNTS